MSQVTLEQVDTYKVPDLLIPRLMKEHEYSEEFATKLVREAKRMLYLSIRANIWISPSIKVDDAWHGMLMFTRFYREFSNFIGGFVDHDPTPGPPDGGASYERTKIAYKETFGIDPDPECWP